MTALFSKPVKPQAAPETPADDPAAIAAREAEAEEERRRRSKGGRASNILTSPLGDTGIAPTASVALLGG